MSLFWIRRLCWHEGGRVTIFFFYYVWLKKSSYCLKSILSCWTAHFQVLWLERTGFSWDFFRPRKMVSGLLTPSAANPIYLRQKENSMPFLSFQGTQPTCLLLSTLKRCATFGFCIMYGNFRHAQQHEQGKFCQLHFPGNRSL